MSSRNEKVLELERGSTKSHTMNNSLWKRLWTDTEYMMMLTVVLLDAHYLVIFSIRDYITCHIQFPRCNVSKPSVLTL